MKKLLYIFLILISFGQSACERDDICAESTPTTPLLVIDFFDADNPSEIKVPGNLAVLEEGETDLENNLRFFNSETIGIPLRTDENQTVYQFIINAAADEESEEPSNEDLLTISYETSEDFVSKACGFRVTYDNLLIQRQAQEDGNWIQSIDIINPTVVNDTITHVRIFH